MQLIVVLPVLFIAVNAVTDYEAWLKFKANHAKIYQNKMEEQHRFQIFQNNLRRIENQNAKYGKGEVSYYFAVNQFADMTSEEFLASLNKQISGKPKFNGSIFNHKINDAPETADWRSAAVLEVRDQGDCKSSWAFSTIGALEGQLAIQKNQKIQLSVQELIDCVNRNGGCLGGDISYAFEYVQQNGSSSEDSYSYIANDNGTCQQGTKVIGPLQGYVSVEARNEDALKSAVGTVGPVSIAVYVDETWQLYSGGIYDHQFCWSAYLNHGALAVGYDSENSTDYWIIKNSWGTAWGEGGYIRLVRGKNQCGVANEGRYPQLKNF